MEDVNTTAYSKWTVSELGFTFVQQEKLEKRSPSLFTVNGVFSICVYYKDSQNKRNKKKSI